MKELRIRMAMPMRRTVMVLPLQPFHSFNMIPQTLLNVTFNAMRMQKEKVMSSGDSRRNPWPNDKPKNWLYHNAPARRQNRILLPQTDLLL